LDVIEVRIGESAVVVVTKTGNPAFNVTPRMMYLALAAQVPKAGEFAPNTVTKWGETTKDKAVPATLPIKVLLPGKSLGQRSLFDDRFLQGGCRHVPEIDAIFGADDRVEKCTKLRTDVVQQIGEPIAQSTLAALENSAPGTLAVTDLTVYKDNPGKMELLPVSGVLPEHKSIDDYSYLAVSPMIFYVKRAHMETKEGGGVVIGIREFMKVVTSDSAVGDKGAFARLGLEPYNEDEIADIRANVRLLRRFER
jgi:phosphate transport system substrate-binding protein